MLRVNEGEGEVRGKASLNVEERTNFFTDPKWGNTSCMKYNMQVIKQEVPDA